MVLTLLAMIFEDAIGIKLAISGCIHAISIPFVDAQTGLDAFLSAFVSFLLTFL